MDDQKRAREYLQAAWVEAGWTPEAAAALAAGNDTWMTAQLSAITAALRAAPEWQPINAAPKDDRVLVRCESRSVYAAHWVQNPVTGDEAWLVCALEDGTQMLVHPVEWMPLPLAARPQGVK